MVSLDTLVRGDLIGVDWVDIAEDATASANDASLARRHSIGYFWARKDDRGIPVLVTTTTLDGNEIDDSNGYCVYPEACVVRVKMIKRKRRKKEETA